MNKQDYIKMLVALHATANKADSADSADSWTKPEYATTHARAIESMLRCVMTKWQYDSYINNGEITEDMDTAAEIQKLKQIAKDRYNEDGGAMFECTDNDGYASYISVYGTAEEAWKTHVEALLIQEENYGYFEF